MSYKVAFLFWRLSGDNNIIETLAVRYSRLPSWDLTCNFCFWFYLQVLFHVYLSSSQTGLLSVHKYITYLEPWFPYWKPSFLKVQLNSFIITRMFPSFSSVVCIDGKAWVLITFMVSPQVHPPLHIWLGRSLEGDLLITDTQVLTK